MMRAPEAKHSVAATERADATPIAAVTQNANAEPIVSVMRPSAAISGVGATLNASMSSPKAHVDVTASRERPVRRPTVLESA